MLGRLGGPELLILLLIVIILFGVGRIGKIAGELGSGIRSFRKGLNTEEETEKPKEENPEQPKQE